MKLRRIPGSRSYNLTLSKKEAVLLSHVQPCWPPGFREHCDYKADLGKFMKELTILFDGVYTNGS